MANGGRRGGARTIGGKTPTPLSEFIDARWDALNLRNHEAADRLGITSPNMISMWRTGQTPIPLGRLQAIAALLAIDVVRLYSLWLQQQRLRDPDISAEFVELIQARTVSQNEADLVRAVRNATKNADPAFEPTTLERVAGALAVS